MSYSKLDIEKIIDSVRNEKWRKRGTWPQNVISYEIYGEGEMTKYQEKIGYPFKKTKLIYYKNDYFDLEREWVSLGRKMKLEYRMNGRYLINYAEDCSKRGQGLINFSEKYKK